MRRFTSSVEFSHHCNHLHDPMNHLYLAPCPSLNWAIQSWLSHIWMGDAICYPSSVVLLLLPLILQLSFQLEPNFFRWGGLASREFLCFQHHSFQRNLADMTCSPKGSRHTSGAKPNDKKSKTTVKAARHFFPLISSCDQTKESQLLHTEECLWTLNM